MSSPSNLVFGNVHLPQGDFLIKLSALLGLSKPLRSEGDLIKYLPVRVDTSVLDNLAKEGLTPKELAVVLPPRTLSHRRARKQPLSPEESDRAVRLARLVALAETVFGDRNKALRWLRKALREFDGRSPLEMMTTEIGGRQVEECLLQIDEGYAA